MEETTNQDILNELLDIRKEQKETDKETKQKPKSDLVDIIESKIAEQNTRLEQRLNDSTDKKMASMFEKIKSNIDSPSFSITPIPAEQPIDKFDKESISYKSTWQELLTRVDVINNKISNFPSEIKLSDNDNKLLQSFSEMIQKNAIAPTVQPNTSDKNSISVEKIDTIIDVLNKQVTQITDVSNSIKEFSKLSTANAVSSDNSKLLESISNLQDSTKTAIFEQTKQQLQAIQSLKDALPSGNNKEIIDSLTKISNLDFSNLIAKPTTQAEQPTTVKPDAIIQQAQSDISYIKSLSEVELDQLKKVAESLPLLADTIKGFSDNVSKINLEPLNKAVTSANSINKKYVTLDKESLDALKALKDSAKPESLNLAQDISRDINAITKPANAPVLDTPVIKQIDANQSPTVKTDNSIATTSPTIEKVIPEQSYLKQGSDIIFAINDLQKNINPILEKINDSIQSLANSKVSKKMSTAKLNSILKEVKTISETKESITNRTPIEVPQIPQLSVFKNAFDIITPSLEKISAIPPETLNKGVEAISLVNKENTTINDKTIETLKPLITEVIIPSIKQDIEPIVKPEVASQPISQPASNQTTNEVVSKKDNSTVKPEQVAAIESNKSTDVTKSVGYDDLAKSDITLKYQDSLVSMPSIKHEAPPEKEKDNRIETAIQEQTKVFSDLVNKITTMTQPEKQTEKTKEKEKSESNAVTNISVTKGQQPQESWQEILISEIRKMNGKLDSLSANLLRKNTNNDLGF